MSSNLTPSAIQSSRAEVIVFEKRRRRRWWRLNTAQRRFWVFGLLLAFVAVYIALEMGTRGS